MRAELWTWLEDPISRYWLGSIVSLICVLIAYAASKLIRDNSLLRTVLALFACGWVLQMGAYSAPREALGLANLASDLVSFLHVFAGVLLIEAAEPRRPLLTVTVLQASAFWLLLTLLVPRRQEFHAILAQSPIDAFAVEMGAALALGLVSFVALGVGAWWASRGGALFWFLAVVLAVYAGLSSYRCLELLLAGPRSSPRLSSELVLAFAAAKLAMTAFFSLLVVMFARMNHRDGADRRQTQ
jgi:hypothetical protein